MSYIEKSLLDGEALIYQARLHWFRYVNCYLLAAIGFYIIEQAGDVSVEVGDNLVQLQVAFGGIFIAAAVFLFIKAWIDQLTSEFVVTDRRVMIKIGLIRRRSLELLLTKVESVGVDQSILGRIFGFGAIIVSGTGATRETFAGIADPLEFRRRVQMMA